MYTFSFAACPWRVALIDPGDFTPAYDVALGAGLIELGRDLRQFGHHGASMRRPGWPVEPIISTAVSTTGSRDLPLLPSAAWSKDSFAGLTWHT
jgi:hypothetical protein